VLAALATGLAASRELLRAQARTARRAVGKPLGEQAFHPDRTYRRKHGRPLTLLMLGDSIAAGLGADRQRDTLGVLLAKQLGRASGRAVRLVPAAEVGGESSWLARQVAAVPDDLVVDVAVVVVGGNDVTHRVPVGRSVAHLEQAITTLRSRGTQVVVGTCPDLGALTVVPQPLRGLAGQASRRLAAAQREATLRNGGHPVSLGDVLGGGLVTERDVLFALDRFHPSSRGYRRIAEALLPAVLTCVPPDPGRPSERRTSRVHRLFTRERGTPACMHPMSKDDVSTRDPENDWAIGFRLDAKKGMTCDICRCLVRQKPGDAEAHRQWHASLDRSGSRDT
jgi:lysophospholipase L1-like esterase